MSTKAKLRRDDGSRPRFGHRRSAGFRAPGMLVLATSFLVFQIPGTRPAACEPIQIPEGSKAGSRPKPGPTTEHKDSLGKTLSRTAPSGNAKAPRFPEGRVVKSPTPSPPVACGLMTDRQLELWAKFLSRESESCDRLCRSFSLAARLPADVKVGIVPADVKDYLEEILGRPLDPRGISVAEFASLSLALACVRAQLAYLEFQAFDEQFTRAISTKGAEKRGAPGDEAKPGEDEFPIERMNNNQLKAWIEYLDKVFKSVGALSAAFSDSSLACSAAKERVPAINVAALDLIKVGPNNDPFDPKKTNARELAGLGAYFAFLRVGVAEPLSAALREQLDREFGKPEPPGLTSPFAPPPILQTPGPEVKRKDAGGNPKSP